MDYIILVAVIASTIWLTLQIQRTGENPATISTVQRLAAKVAAKTATLKNALSKLKGKP